MQAQPQASHFVNGTYLEDAKGAAMQVIFPGTGEIIAEVREATPHVIDAALAAAKAAQGPWAALKPVERGRILRRAADIIRLCMLTGARVGEVRQARFEHFNLEHLSWSKPASMTKQRKVHRLPISEEAAAIVRQRQLLVPRGCQLLFPGDVPGQPVKEIRRFWSNIQKQVGINVELLRLLDGFDGAGDMH